MKKQFVRCSYKYCLVVEQSVGFRTSDAGGLLNAYHC
jgi:hypothetical protein